MNRLAALLTALVVAAGCGHGSSQPTTNSGPPDALIDAGAKPRPMLQGTSCWQSGNAGRCIDAAGTEALLPLMPRVTVKRGSDVHMQLGFDPTNAELTVGGRKVAVDADQSITFTPTRGGVVTLSLTANQGDTQYLARIVFTR